MTVHYFSSITAMMVSSIYIVQTLPGSNSKSDWLRNQLTDQSKFSSKVAAQKEKQWPCLKHFTNEKLFRNRLTFLWKVKFIRILKLSMNRFNSQFYGSIALAQKQTKCKSCEVRSLFEEKPWKKSPQSCKQTSKLLKFSSRCLSSLKLGPKIFQKSKLPQACLRIC